MAKVAGFRSREQQEAFLEKYDRAVAELWPVPAVEEDIATDYGVTHVRWSGPTEGRAPLVLLHPHMGTSVVWHRLAGTLSAGRQVIAVDTVGALGRSVQTRPITGPADYAAWLGQVVDGLAWGAVHLCGYSEGGYVAMCAALGVSGRLRSLVAIEPGGAISRVKARFLASMAWAGIRAQFDKGALRAFADRLAPGAEIPDAEWDMAEIGMYGFRQGLPRPKRFTDAQLGAMRDVPMLLYMGADTQIYDPEAAATRARALLPNAEAVIVDGAGHGLPFQFPDRTAAVIGAFLARHDEPPQP
jgi:pimeloyl-ACP methyl ester carboxylesterase